MIRPNITSKPMITIVGMVPAMIDPSPPHEGLCWTTNLALYCMLFFPLKQAFFVLYRISY